MAGALEGLPAGRTTGADGPRFEGVFNVVTQPEATGKRGARKLPTLFFGRAPVFVDRSVDKVATRLVRAVELATEAWRRPTYLLQPCVLDGRPGLYARDLLNRSAFRARLRRLGVEFTEDPFVTFTDTDRFNCRDWGDFEPSFVITPGYEPEDPDEIMESTDALLAFRLATFRMGAIEPQELKRLVRVCTGLDSASAKNAEAIVARLSR